MDDHSDSDDHSDMDDHSDSDDCRVRAVRIQNRRVQYDEHYV